MISKHRNTATLALGFLILGAYVFSYTRISMRGRFEPVIIGLNGVKRFSWAPEGFVSDFKWSKSKMVFYFPLHLIDTWIFHISDEARRGKYPTNDVHPSEIGRVYKAWEL